MKCRIIQACSMLCAVAAMLCGCIGYRLGTTLPAGMETIHVPTFFNKCGEPLVENDATEATIREFQKDGTLEITDSEHADLILSVTLTDYKLESTRFDRDDPRTTKEYRLRLTANLTLTENETKGVFVKNQRVEGETTFYPGGDLNSAKRAALPKATADLAHKIVERVVEAW